MNNKLRSYVSQNSNCLSTMIKGFSMNKTTKAFSLAVAMFAIVGMSGALGSPVLADPAPEGTKKVYQFNMIAKPNSYEGNCGNGDRVFIDADDRSSVLRISYGEEWNITDCNATSDRRGQLEVAETGTYVVYAIAHGKPGTGIDVCVDWEETVEEEGDFLCEIGNFDVKRTTSKSQMKFIHDDFWDPDYDDILWEIDSTGQAKIQFRIYQVLP